MFSLPKFSIKRPVCILLCVVSLIVFGLSSVLGMPLESTPAIEMPILMILTSYYNATPEEVDSMVTEVIEDSLANITAIAQTYSYSVESFSMVMLQFDYGVDIDKKYSDVDSALSAARLQLPDKAEAPLLMEINIQNLSNSAIMMLSVEAEAGENTKAYIEDTVVPEIERIEGVADVSVSGGARKYVQVLLDENKLNQYGLTINSVSAAITGAEFSFSIGSLDRGDVSVAMLGSAELTDYLDTESIPLTLPSGDVIHIRDVAAVSMQNEADAAYSRTDGKESISLTISKNQSANTVDICDEVAARVKTLNQSDLGVQLAVTYNSGEAIKDNLKDVAVALLEGLLIAMAVLWLFLGDWKTSLIIGLSMPLSVFAALCLMSAFGMSLNIISLGGLLIGIGMLVDNSIVVIDSCFQAQTTLKTLEENVIDGANLVLGAITSSTITTIVVFLPIGLMQGMMGQFFRDICYTIVFSLVASLLSAITLVPLLFTRLHPVEKTESRVAHGLKRLENAYARLLARLLNRRAAVIGVSVAMLLLAAFLFFQLDMELIADSSSEQLTLNVQMRNGLNLESTVEVLEQVEAIVSAEPDVKSYTITSGSGSGINSLMGGTSGASVSVTLKEDAAMSTDEFVTHIRAKTAALPNCQVTAQAQQNLSLNATTVAVTLQGKNLDTLRTSAEDVRAVMMRMPDFDAVSTSLVDGAPQAKIIVDPVLAGAVGLTPAAVLSSVRSMLSGVEAMTYTQDNTEYSVMVEFPPERYQNVADLYGLILPTPYGGQVVLTDIAQIEYASSPESLTRQNGQYLVSITGTPKVGLNINALTAKVMAQVQSQMVMPSGVTFAEGSDIQTMMEEFRAMGKALLIAVYLVFVVMAVQFESLRFSALVMISVPFSLTGAFLALYLSKSTINAASLLGIIMLSGIVVNNAIVLIDYTNILRAQDGLSPSDALIAAGRSRLRPILMTTLTTVCGLIPMAFASSVETMKSLALSVIGGLTLSTVLTLILIPTFYLLFDKDSAKGRRAEKRARRNARRARRGKGTEPPAE